MKLACDLQTLSRELRDMLRRGWDEHLMGFCEALLMQHAGLERAWIPVDTQRPTIEAPRPRLHHF
jgi:hypothetical protein